ncbi:type II toxin-antitoxin system RelE/ParE family toxin [Mesorhizobium sp. M0006]|uniref:type II toxin-antitoxin system RelE/ParE family toxin n=1 Tax=Mesorhizobium sp. M0006 TaxID=2956838 RepID=UPI00333C1E08
MAVAFAFDRKRKAILLVAGDKSGMSEKRFYKSLIAKADKRYQGHLGHGEFSRSSPLCPAARAAVFTVRTSR